MQEKRIIQIYNYIKDKKVVSNGELCSKFNISYNTLRRDISYIEKEGNIQKVYGGVKYSESYDTAEEGGFLENYNIRELSNVDEKTYVAKLASTLVKDDDIIFIDTGTSTVLMLPFLKDKKNLTIITNSIYVLYKALEYEQLNVYSLPGKIKSKTGSLIGSNCIEELDKFNINQSFMACSAISINEGVSNSSIEEYNIKKKVLTKCSINTLLTDSSKYGKRSLISFGKLTDFNNIICEKDVRDEYTEFFETNGINFIV